MTVTFDTSSLKILRSGWW